MILHLDGDNFFVSCELLRRRDLLGKAVVVGEERGIATAMNIEAKRLGITRGYPIYKLRQQWSEAEVAVLPSHFDMYQQLGSQVLKILEKYSSTIEAYSVDESFVRIREKTHPCTCTFRSTDIFLLKNSSCSLQSSLASLLKAHVQESFFLQQRTCREMLCKLISIVQKDIYDSTGLWYSCGIARTKALAKIASKRNKPQGICVIMPEDETEVLETTPIENVWGIGRRLAPKMQARGIYTGRGYRDAPRHALGDIADKWTLELQDELKGIERYPLGSTERPFQKSVETTRAFGFSSCERSFVVSEFSRNVETVCSRLTQLGVVASYAYFFIRTKNKYRIYGESALIHATQNPLDVLQSIEKKFAMLVDAHMTSRGAHDRGVMGTGICMTDCVPKEASTSSLFDAPEVSNAPTCIPSTAHSARRSLEDVLEGLRSSYGGSVVQLASSLESTVKRKSAKNERNKKDVEITGGEYIYGLPLVYLGEVS